MAKDLPVKTQNNPLAPQTFDQAIQFSEMAARSELVPKDFRGKPGNILIAMQMGFELGLQPMQAIQNIAVINGRASVWGDAMIALVRSSPFCEWVKESFDERTMAATCSGKRRGDPDHQTSTFSRADAEQAKLWGKAGPWSQYPKRMLQMRARGFLLRDLWPDVLKGMISAEEAADYSQEAVVVSEVRTMPQVMDAHTDSFGQIDAYTDFFSQIEKAGSIEKLKEVWAVCVPSNISDYILGKCKTAYIKRLDEIRAADTSNQEQAPNDVEPKAEPEPATPPGNDLQMLIDGLASCFSKDAVNGYVGQCSGALMSMSASDNKTFEQETFERVMELGGSSELFSNEEAAERFLIIKTNINAKRKPETLEAYVSSIKNELNRFPEDTKAAILTLIEERKSEIG